MFTILLPLTLPSLIMSVVVIMLRTIFWAVPAFSLVLPVTNSGPTTTTTGYSVTSTIGPVGLQVIHPVRMPFSRAFWMPTITYGVVPDAAMPITVSLVLILKISSSFHALLGSSSAASTALR